MAQQDEVLGRIAEVETLALRGSGSTDPAALRRIESLVSRLKSYPRTADKPQSVLDWAKVLFSARKHRTLRWTRRSPALHPARLHEPTGDH